MIKNHHHRTNKESQILKLVNDLDKLRAIFTDDGAKKNQVTNDHVKDISFSFCNMN